MSDRYTKEELIDKTDWEGGVTEAITGYGISPSALPEDAPEPVVQAWTRIYEQTRKDIRTIQEWFDQAVSADG